MGLLFTASIHGITADISNFQHLLPAFPRHHPLRSYCALFLSLLLLKRYELLNQKDDFDQATLYFTDSLLSLSLSWLPDGPMIVAALSLLADSLIKRSEVSKEPEGAIYAAKYLRYLRDPAHAPFASQSPLFTEMLVRTLTLQMHLKACDVVQTLEELTALTHELLTSDPSSSLTTHATACFTSALSTHKLPELSPELLNEIIECLRLARMHKPELREVPHFLAYCLLAHYYHTMNDDDLDEIVSILDETIASSSPGDKYLPKCQEFMAVLAKLRSIPRQPEHSEEAIYRARAFLASSSVEDPLYPTWSNVLEDGAKNRFKTSVRSMALKHHMHHPAEIHRHLTQLT